ncbi:actin-related protein 2/3 complex subunit 5 [Phlyctochytrium arcticum]|nr:actin-related protein 2/3 complex subunit 5 [Phlyctochytrium arcticum]
MAHRKIDVDKYDDEDAFIDEEQTSAEPTASSAEVEDEVNARASEVRAALSRSDYAGAVAKALENPPAGAQLQAAKDKNTATVMEALAAARATDIPTICKSLSTAQMDILMKYIYRGMASPELYNSAVLLTWHEKTTEIGGVGSIMRVLTDRKRV